MVGLRQCRGVAVRFIVREVDNEGVGIEVCALHRGYAMVVLVHGCWYH
jgi:hypothetical protein